MIEDASNTFSPRGFNLSGAVCSLCQDPGCFHITALENLLNIPPGVEFCEVEGHEGEKKSYFCQYKECWKPVCGACSQKGSHKLHETAELVRMRDYLEKSYGSMEDRLTMLLSKVELDKWDKEREADNHKRHTEEIYREIDLRRREVLREVEDAYNKALTDAKEKEKAIQMEHNKRIEKTKALYNFLQVLHKVIDASKVDKKLNIPQYVHLLKCIDSVDNMVDNMRENMSKQAESHIHRLVAFDPVSSGIIATNVSSQPQRLSVLKYSKFNEHVPLVDSMAVLASGRCVLTCRISSQGWRRSHDVFFHYKLQTYGSIKEDFVIVPRGKYYLTELPSGELVAAYAGETDKNEPRYSLKYCRNEETLLYHSKQYGRDEATLLDWAGNAKNYRSPFESITDDLAFEPSGIAATGQNTVVVTSDVEEKGKQASRNAKLLSLMSLRGTQLECYLKLGEDPLSLRTVAVSDTGKVCACDPSNSTLVLLDHNLSKETRLKFSWPTSMSRLVMKKIANGREPTDKDICFRPEGVCFDHLGRIVVADSINHAVLRLSPISSRSTERQPPSACYAGEQYKIEPLVAALGEDDHELINFRSPRLISLDKDCRHLWVVCQEYIYIFRYRE